MFSHKTAILVLAVGAPAMMHISAERHVPETLVVRMVDKSATEYEFQPSALTAHPGDVVRFVQTALNPHNVEFRATPDGADLGTAKMGPFLTTPDQTYEITINDGFTAGTYSFVCTPHEFFGMKGTLTIEPGS